MVRLVALCALLMLFSGPLAAALDAPVLTGHHDRLAIRWTPDGDTGYEVRWKTADQTWDEATVRPYHRTHMVLWHVQAGATYEVQVRTVPDGEWSPTATIMLPTGPAPPELEEDEAVVGSGTSAESCLRPSRIWKEDPDGIWFFPKPDNLNYGGLYMVPCGWDGSWPNPPGPFEPVGKDGYRTCTLKDADEYCNNPGN